MFLQKLSRLVVRLYPKPFRERFGHSLTESLVDRVEALRSDSLVRRWLLSTRAVMSVVAGAMKERMAPSYRPPDEPGPQPRSAMIERIAQDVAFAVRSLRRRPGFTLTALTTLALGIGANTAVFSVVDGVLLRPLPYPAPGDELFMLWSHDTKDPDRETTRAWMSLPDLTDARELPGLASVEGWQMGSFTLAEGGEPERVDAARVTGSMLQVFGLAPAAGRDLRHDENNRSAPRVAMIGHRFWQDRLGGRPDVVGTTLRLSEQTFEVVGVAPPGFDFPEGSQLWVPYRHPDEGCGRGCTVYEVVGRVHGESTLPAQAEPLDALAFALADEYPDTNTDKGFHLEPLIDYLVGDVRAGLWILLGAVGLVLLIVCTNLANLLLARSRTRRSEVAVRSALGASRKRLVAQMLTESLVISTVGTALGIALSVVLIQGFLAFAPDGLPRLDGVGLNGAVLAFAVISSLVVGVLFGLSPALRLAQASLAADVGAGRRGGSRMDGRTRSVLISLEIALSLSLVAGAALLVRSVDRLYGVDLGFRAEHVLRFSLSLPGSRYDSLDDFVSFYGQLEERIAGLPGVTAVGSAYGSPFGGGTMGGTVLVEGRPEPEPGQELSGRVRVATPGYFDAMGLDLAAGRWLDERDRSDTEPVALINQTLVRQHFPGQDPIGERVRITSSFGWAVSDYYRVVGVVRDVKRTLRGDPYPAMYLPHSQFGAGFLRVHVRGSSEAVAQLMPSIRGELSNLDPNLAPSGVHTVRDAIRSDASSTRFYMLLVGAFALLAILVASVGLYGVVAYLSAERTQEFGIRMALGAQQPDIAGMVVRQGLAPTLWGIGLGVILFVFAGRWLESILFGVDPRDPTILVAVSVLVALVAIMASLLPARRATRVDPTDALRAEGG